MISFRLINENRKYYSQYGEISSYIYEEKKSKFLCYVFACSNVNEANNSIEKIRKNNYDAKHIVYFYSIICDNSSIIKFSDDGEPQGTGTKAIYEMLKKECISNVCIVIVRYFGGILLGAGPLSRAYLNSFKGAYLLLNKEKIIEYRQISYKINYVDLKNFEYTINDFLEKKDIIILEKIFKDQIEIKLKISKDKFEHIINKLKNIKGVFYEWNNSKN